MLVINDFFVRYKEAVSNQMELIAKVNKAKIVSATRFMGQQAMQQEDTKDNIYVYSPIKYFFQTVKETYKARNERIHVFEEEPCIWKRVLFNKTGNPLYISMYRRPTEKYAKHLKKYKNLKKVFVELPQHKDLLIGYGIDEDKIELTPTPSKIERKKSQKKYDPNSVKILFASWNNKEGNAIRERGLEYLLELLKENPNYTLTIPLRDNDTETFNIIAKKIGVSDRIKLLEIHNNTEILTQLFDDSDFVAFVPQKRIVKDVPNSLIDGIVRGKPVIISDVIDFSQEVKKFGIGIVVPGGEKSFKKVIEMMKKYKNNDNTRFVAPSKFYANEYKKLTECEISFIPHAIDKTRIETDKSEDEICEQYNIDRSKIKIIVPQRLEPNQKQPQLLLDACCLMNDEEKSKIEIIYTGLDKQYEKFVDSLKKRANENNISIKIIRFDYMSEVYKIADMCVLPSKSESFGYSALEALSLGIYTILNDIPTFNELTVGNDYNYIFKNNKNELKKQIIEIISNKSYIERKIPSEKWQKKYDINVFENSYISMIK